MYHNFNGYDITEIINTIPANNIKAVFKITDGGLLPPTFKVYDFDEEFFYIDVLFFAELRSYDCFDSDLKDVDDKIECILSAKKIGLENINDEFFYFYGMEGFISTLHDFDLDAMITPCSSFEREYGSKEGKSVFQFMGFKKC